MCLAIALQSLNDMVVDIDEKYINNGWETNPDGAGFSYVDMKKGTIMYHKGFFVLEEFKTALYKARGEHPDSKFLVHLRWASKGIVNTKNCHPFFVNDNTAYIHNGTINKLDVEGDDSDTITMSRFMSVFPEKFYMNDAYKTLIEDFIGKSKFVFLNSDNEMVIFNESLGEYHDDIWFSNDFYLGKKIRNGSGFAVTKPTKILPFKGKKSNENNDKYCPVCKTFLHEDEEKLMNKCYTCALPVDWAKLSY